MISNNSYPLSSRCDRRRDYCWDCAESVHCRWINCELAALGLAVVYGSKKTPNQPWRSLGCIPLLKWFGSQDDTESQGDAHLLTEKKGTKATHTPSKLCFWGLWGKPFCVSTWRPALHHWSLYFWSFGRRCELVTFCHYRWEAPGSATSKAFEDCMITWGPEFMASWSYIEKSVFCRTKFPR